MRRIVVLLAAVVLMGWASPLLAGTPNAFQVFYVTVYENGSVRDTGFLQLLPDDGSGNLRLKTWWFGKGAWKEKGQWEVLSPSTKCPQNCFFYNEDELENETGI